MLVIANWKMHKTVVEAVATARQIRSLVRRVPVTVVIAPSFTALERIGRVLRGGPVQLAAQDVHWESWGAFTGAVSPLQLRDVGCQWAIIGHSERRRLFGESDAVAGLKVGAALAHRLRPILCVGETLEERVGGDTLRVVERQLERGLVAATAATAGRMVVAYEPVWAIGTGETAEPAQIQEAHGLIRRWLDGRFGAATSRRIPILYGGSVSPENIQRLGAVAELNGVLVGGAALAAEPLAEIVRVLAGAPANAKPKRKTAVRRTAKSNRSH